MSELPQDSHSTINMMLIHKITEVEFPSRYVKIMTSHLPKMTLLHLRFVYGVIDSLF